MTFKLPGSTETQHKNYNDYKQQIQPSACYLNGSVNNVDQLELKSVQPAPKLDIIGITGIHLKYMGTFCSKEPTHLMQSQVIYNS